MTWPMFPSGSALCGTCACLISVTIGFGASRTAWGDLEGLTDFLYLHDNELTELPPSLMRLKRLRYLNISENAFEVLPESVTGMFGLIELRATDNRLTYLPPAISRLTRLRELHVRNNRLTTCRRPWARCPSCVRSISEGTR
jgi:hypothetical protein